MSFLFLTLRCHVLSEHRANEMVNKRFDDRHSRPMIGANTDGEKDFSSS